MIHYNFITKMFQRKISSLLFSSVRALVKRKLGKEPEVDPMNSYHYRSSVTHSHFDSLMFTFQEQVIKFANYLLSRKHAQSIKDAGALLFALDKLGNNPVSVFD